MLNFTEIKKIITACCHSGDQNIFNFNIDYKKLDEELTKQGGLHVLSFAETGYSEPLYLSSLQLISEYIKRPKEFDMIYSDNAPSEYIKFMLYIGDEFIDTEGNNISFKDMFNILNGDNLSNGSITTAVSIVKKLPVYRVIVVRKYHPKKEKFDYMIYFRSNNEMITYIKGLSPDDFKKKSKDKNESNVKVAESFDCEEESEESTVKERNCSDSEE